MKPEAPPHPHGAAGPWAYGGTLGAVEHDAALLVAGLIVGGGLITAICRWPWPERTRGPWLRWTWAPTLAAVCAIGGGLLGAAGQRAAFALVGAAVGLTVAALGLRRGERDDVTSQNPRRRQRAERRVGPGDLLLRRRACRVLERGGDCADDSDAGVAIGRDRRGVPVALSSQQLLRSGVISGTVGSGKTTAARWIVSRVMRGGFGAIWVEAKGDPAMRDWLMCEAALRGVPYYEFAIRGPSNRWNPVAGAAGAVERRDLVYAATQAGEDGAPEYYRALFKEHALAVLGALEAAGRASSLPALRRAWNVDRLRRVVAKADDAPADLGRYVDDLLLPANSRRRVDVESTATRLSDVVDACDDRLDVADAEPGEILDLRAVIERRAVCLISLDAATYPAVTKALGQLVVADAMAACAPWIARRELARCMLVLDEFPRYSGPQVGELMALVARAAGMPVILATQDVADLDGVSAEFRSQVFGCANYYLIGAVGSPESADFLARAAGMRERVEATHQVNIRSLSFDRITGLGTEAYGREWVIHPDELQRLRTGQAALVTKNPHSARVLDLYRPEDPSALLASFNEVRAKRGRPKLNIAGVERLHAAARRLAAAA